MPFRASQKVSSMLVGLPLVELDCDLRTERDREIVRAIQTITTINGKPAADYWDGEK